MADRLAAGDLIELRVTPDRYVAIRYAGASGDFNPIHIDEDFAREVGLPGCILHGLWTMAQVARAATEAAGDDPTALRSLSVSFRGMGRIGQEIVVRGEVRAVTDGLADVQLDAVQGDVRLIKGATAELRLR
ncbi:MAG: MaoC/PaaZ C-terminal domain-containing protein [Solirubrobacteraceae bacterium]